jgi:hypothetical protein
MNPFHRSIATTLAAACLAIAPAAPAATPGHADLSGVHDFDFLFGQWRVHHRKLKERLANSDEWIEYDGTCDAYPIMDGLGNVDDNVNDLPGDHYRAATMRAYDAASGTWAIWFLDGRTPSANIDPPVKGRFVDGVGAFYSNEEFNGRPIVVRYQWSHATPDTAHWEQAFSPDGGKTWEVNWRMDFVRVKPARGQ